MDADIQREYARQREHLERSVASLRKKLAKDSEIHRADNVRIMQVCHCTLYISVKTKQTKESERGALSGPKILVEKYTTFYLRHPHGFA